jgi:calcineurin-like phosphoesterase family protein
MKTFITADWHLGETRLGIMGRPAASADEMIEILLRGHNQLAGIDEKTPESEWGVKDDDIVIVAGDVLYKGADPKVYLPMIARFRGRKVLIRGNHDAHISDEDFAPYFDQIVEDGDGIGVNAAGLLCYVTHYPTRGKPNVFNLVGHIHSAWRYQLNMMNIGVDANHFMPVDLATIPNHLKAITEFYDKDVWCAYDNINAKYQDERGRKSKYFDG